MVFFRRAAFLLLTILAGVEGAAQAGTGHVITLPLPRVKPRSGVVMSIDTRWVTGSGYRPVRVRITPIIGGPAVADRYFDVTIRPHGWYPGMKANAATATVHLAQGELYGEVLIDIPQSCEWGSYEVKTTEDGRILRDLSERSISTGANFYYYNHRDSIPSILLIHRMAPGWSLPTRMPQYAGAPGASLSVSPVLVPWGGATSIPLLYAGTEPPKTGQPAVDELNLLPDIRILAGRIWSNQNYYGQITADRLAATSRTTDAETMRLVGELPSLDVLPPDALPDRWLSWSGLDVVIASLDELEHLAKVHPQTWNALRTWHRTGTTLCVYGVGRDYEHVPRLEALLGLPDSGDSAGGKLTDWEKPRASNFRESIRALESIGANYSRAGNKT
jgi:hypothetical protein